MLDLSIQDEYRSRATYARVLVDFPNQKPFSNIVEAEVQHISAVSTLFTNRGLAVPADTYAIDAVSSFSTLVAACSAAANGESATYKMYEDFLAKLAEEPADVVNVFTNLRNASRDKHLPAFINCAK
jgi:hypothetical protein